MSLEVLTIKNSIKAAFEDAAETGNEFSGWRVYDAEDKHKRIFFPHIVVYTPVSTLTGRFSIARNMPPRRDSSSNGLRRPSRRLTSLKDSPLDLLDL